MPNLGEEGASFQAPQNLVSSNKLFFFMIRSLDSRSLIVISKHISFTEVHTILKSGLDEIAPYLFVL